MSDKGNFMLRAVAIAASVAAFLSPFPVHIVPALAQPRPDVEQIAASERVALYITLCLWSEQRQATCRELRLTPGAAGPTFASMAACQDGQEEALHKWIAEAGSVFGVTAMAGDGYRIEGQRCGPVVSTALSD